jgi:hypothetical protein
MPAKRAGSHTLSNVAADIYDRSVDRSGCTAFEVVNPTSNTVNVLINIPGLHSRDDSPSVLTEDFFEIPPDGIPRVFQCAERGITRVQAKSASGTPTIYAGVVAKS